MKKNKKLRFWLSLIPLLIFPISLYFADYFKEDLVLSHLFLDVGAIIFIVFLIWSAMLYRDMVAYLNFRGYFSLKAKSKEEMHDIVKNYVNQNGYEKVTRYKKADVYIKNEDRIINIIALVFDKQSTNDIFYSLYNKCAGMEEKKRNKRYNVVVVACGDIKKKKGAFSYGGNVSKLGITVLDFNFEEGKVFLDTGTITYNKHLRQHIKKVFDEAILFD